MQSRISFASRGHVCPHSFGSLPKARAASVCSFERINTVNLAPRSRRLSRLHSVYDNGSLKSRIADIYLPRLLFVRKSTNSALPIKDCSVNSLDGEENERSDSKAGLHITKYFHPRPERGTTKSEFTYRSYIEKRPSPLSPSAVLALWLDSKSKSDRDSLWDEYAETDRLKNATLPKILLGHLHRVQHMGINPHSPAHHFTASELEALLLSGFSTEDVYTWGNILTAPTDDEVAQRYLASQAKKPLFLLREVLRRPRLSVRSFRALLTQFWDFLLHTPPKYRLPNPKESNYNTLCTLGASDSPNDNSLLEENLFTALVIRLLHRARQLLAPALVSITQMIIFYCERLAHDNPSGGPDLEPKLHKRLSNIYNMTISRLALPASIHPMLSMTHNWHAQRLLLESAGTFRPPLQLDKISYRAVSQVLVASKKTPQEAKYSSLVQRPWPPWRKEQDGMDVDRSPEEDISRVAATISRMKESGYEEDTVDRAIKILGGREPDGTPTIQTRRLVKVRTTNQSIKKDAQEVLEIRAEWAARIEATRDVREAWDAFQGFASSGRRPSISMYRAMFTKLIFNAMRNERQSLEALPGDGLEVLAVLDDNLTRSEMLRLQPPSIDVLFTRMLEDGYRPSGRLLDLLISSASSFRQVIAFLKHSTLQPGAARHLFIEPKLMSRLTLERIPNGILVAFTKFLSWPNRGQIILQMQSNTPTARQPKMVDASNHGRFNSLRHAYDIVNCRQSSSCIVWNELFKALSRRGAMLQSGADHYENDILTWRLLEASLEDSQRAGAQLDPDGLRFLCQGLQKAQLASSQVTEDVSGLVRRGLKVAKKAFATLSEAAQASYGLPRLLYFISGAHLHMYFQVMGFAHDSDEVLAALRWMVQHQRELSEMAQDARNGVRLLRRTIIAARAFFDTGESADADVVASLQDVIAQLEGWGGWPTDEEVKDYLARWKASKG